MQGATVEPTAEFAQLHLGFVDQIQWRYEVIGERTLNRLQTLCDDGTRAVSTWNKTLERWDTTVTERPKKTCVGQMNSKTRQVEVRCQ
jgi:hypothetical protein